MRTAWVNAKKKRWRNNPKRYPPIFEIYYDRIPSADHLRAYADRARRAVEVVTGLPLYQQIRDLEPSGLLWVDPVDEGFSDEIIFPVPPFEAISAPDLVIREGDRVVIVDWKTGKENESDRVQMEAAAVWAVEKLVPEDAEIEGALVYTGTGEVKRFSLGRVERERACGVIRNDMEEMASLLEDPEKNIPRGEDSFPRRDNSALCRYCEFQEICFGMGNRE